MLADFTGDGKLDWAVGGTSGGHENLEIFPYPFNPTVKYSVGQPAVEFSTDGEAGDIDSDGDIDIIAPEWAKNVRVFKNGGSGQQWSEAPTITNDGISTKDVELADFNKDGKLDVALRPDHGSIRIAYNNGAGASWNIIDVAPTKGAEGMDSGDIDNDGDVDLIGQGEWYVNPGSAAGSWQTRTIGQADPTFRAVAADFNKDGKMDVAYSCAECGSENGSGGFNMVTVYLQTAAAWSAQSITQMDGAHTLEAADFDGDGDVDLFVGSMAQTGSATAVLENSGTGTAWTRRDLTNATGGIHVGRAGDIDADKDIDVIGSNWAGGNTVNIWENKTQKAGCVVGGNLNLGPACSLAGGGGNGGGGGSTLDTWKYIHVDSSRVGTQTKWGLGMGDIDGDGDGDIVSGQYYYLNPGGNMEAVWVRREGLASAYLVIDINSNATKDVISLEDGPSWWEWNGSQLERKGGASSPSAGQGSSAGQIVAGGPPEVVYSTEDGSDNHNWSAYMATFGDTVQASKIAQGLTSEGVDLGDFNKDGKLDLVASDGNNVAWFQNNGTLSGWQKHILGSVDHGDGAGGFTDRTSAADIDKDGQIDVVHSEETFGAQADTYWFKNPGGNATGAWVRSKIVTQGTTNSMSVADMDGDGDIDVVTGEHRGSKEVAVWENDGIGAVWKKHLVDSGKESHGGAKVYDLDGDGDFDIVSIAYDKPEDLHVWRNDGQKTGGGGGCLKKSTGDANCDGQVDISDYATWRSEYVVGPGDDRDGDGKVIDADFSGDGKSTIIDFEIWRTNIR